MNHSRGFIALISMILISVVLLLTVVTSNFSNYVARYNIFDSELKEVSTSLAEACANTAILKLAVDNTYFPPAGGYTINLGSNQCQIVSVCPHTSSWPKTIQAQAKSNNIYTNLQVVIPDATHITAWDEMPTLPPPSC